MKLVSRSARLRLWSRLSSFLAVFLSGVLDGFSSFLFCLPFSSLTHLLSFWCIRLLAEE
jgi:hypothetical protein